MAFIKAHGAGIRTYVPRGGMGWYKEVVAYVGEFIDTRPHDFLGRRSSARDTRMFTRANEPSRVTTLPDPLNCNDCTEHSAASAGRPTASSTRRVLCTRSFHPRRDSISVSGEESIETWRSYREEEAKEKEGDRRRAKREEEARTCREIQFEN